MHLPTVHPVDAANVAIGDLVQTPAQLHLLHSRWYSPLSLIQLLTDSQLFWVLWWYNMLFPALLTRTLYEVLRRRIFKYPTASELRSRLLVAGRADAFADALTVQLESHTSYGLGLRCGAFSFLMAIHVQHVLRDVWRVWRLVTKGKKQKAMAMAQKGIDVSPVQNETSSKEEEIEDANFRRFVLATMEEIADFNERLVK